MEFLGRKRELEEIRSALESDSFEGIVVYGRRRVGKSELLKEAARSFEGKLIYYQASLDTPTANAISFSYVIKEAFPELVIGQSSSFEEEMDFLFSRSMKEKLLVVIDEYPYMRDGKATDSLLQRLIDKYRHSSMMKLILCGSYVDVMKEMLQNDAPLSGRMQRKMEVTPFDYLDASGFFPNASNEDKFRYYASFGGVPYYLSFIDERKSYEENVKQLIVREGSILEGEILSTLYSEMNKIDKSFSIMTSIANGSRSYKEIKSSYQQKVGDSNFDYVLNLLLKIGFLHKDSPIDAREDRKKTYYEIEDNLLAFYYCLVFPRIAYRPLMSLDAFYDRFVKERLESFFLPFRFERIAKEFLIRENKKKKEDVFYDIGKYFYNSKQEKKQIEVDLVTEDEIGYTFYECKYTRERIGNPVVGELISKARESIIKPYRLGFFSRNGFEENVDGNKYVLFSLDDFYGG